MFPTVWKVYNDDARVNKSGCCFGGEGKAGRRRGVCVPPVRPLCIRSTSELAQVNPCQLTKLHASTCSMPRSIHHKELILFAFCNDLFSSTCTLHFNNILLLYMPCLAIAVHPPFALGGGLPISYKRVQNMPILGSTH